MKGLLKLLVARKSNYVAFRGPMIKIHSLKYTLKDVDFKHVPYGLVCQAICRSNSLLSTLNPLRLLPSESYRDRAFSLCGPLGDNDSCVLKDMEAIRPSISEVETSTSCEPRTSISTEPTQLGILIGKSISEALHKLQDNLTINLTTKPI